jgi:hypothetical protein
VIQIWWEPELTGLVHAWAEGASWSELIASTSLDEGDVVRVMRRTVDLLAQLPYAEVISEQLRTKARKALRAINRFPVCELEDLIPKGQNGNGVAPEQAQGQEAVSASMAGSGVLPQDADSAAGDAPATL